MPKYTNSTSHTIFSGEPFVKLTPGVTTTDKYIRDLPTGITLTDHEPTVSPWILIETVESTPMTAPADVYGWDNILVYNASDAVALVSANQDDDNGYPVMAATKELFSNELRVFGCLEVLSKGNGNVYVYGVR